jgi:hypothetical protein
MRLTKGGGDQTLTAFLFIEAPPALYCFEDD